MSQRKLWPALGLATAVALGGNAYAQPGGTPGMTPPDAAAPAAPAERISPSADAASSDDKPTKTAHKKHSKKKTQPAKPADNDNNAAPNTALPSPPPQPTPQ